MGWSTLPPGAGWTICEGFIRRFEQGWRNGPRPDIADFVQTDSPHRLRLLVELVHIDLEFRLRLGEWVRVEEYLERFPELQQDELALDLISAEYALRQRWMNPPWPEEYLLRFPHYVRELPTRFQVQLTAPPPLSVPVHRPELPGYELLEELGRGGMGIVWKARDLRLDRLVAIKTLLIAGAASEEDRVRFRREGEAQARLDHPQVAPIYEVGEHQGICYLVMKYYPGGNLAHALPEWRARASDWRKEAARLVAQVARAVHHAHQRGILHRDLKPSNILLDAEGQPHVADFGLARLLDSGLTATTGPIGTPSYMAPEQALGSSKVVISSDVYGLGAILYEMLTGRPPFAEATVLATLDRVVNAEVPRPRSLDPQLSRDLETICLKCLEKDPERRYTSPAALADDLDRWRAGESILARPAGPLEQAWRWARRRPFVAGMMGLTTVALLFSLVILLISNDQLSRKEAETARLLANEQRALAGLELALKREVHSNYLERITHAGRLWGSNQTQRVEVLLNQIDESLRHWEWHFLDGLRASRPEPIPAHRDWVGPLASTSRGKLATAGRDGMVILWDVSGRRPLRRWRAHPGPVSGLVFSPLGDWLASADARSVKVWDVETGKLRWQQKGGGWLAVSGEGKRLAFEVEKTIRIHEVATGQEMQRLAGHGEHVVAAQFHPSGNELLTSGLDRTIRRWDLRTGKQVGEAWERPIPVTRLSYAEQGKYIVEGLQGRIRLLDAQTGELKNQLDGVAYGKPMFVVSPDSPHLAYLDRSQIVHLLYLPNLGQILSYHGQPTTVSALGMLGRQRNGRPVLVTGDREGKLRLWEERHEEVKVLSTTGDLVGGLDFAPEGTLVAVAQAAPRLASELEVEIRLVGLQGQVHGRQTGCGDIVFHPEGKWFATGHPHDGVVLWQREPLARRWTVPLEQDSCTRLRFCEEGKYLVIGTQRGWVSVHEVETGKRLRRWQAHSQAIEGLACHPDEEVVATCTREEGVRLWRGGKRLRELPGGARAVQFSPSGKGLVVGQMDHVARMWNWKTGTVIQTYSGHEQPITDVAFHPQGERLATASSDQTVRLWVVETGQEVLTLPGTTGAVSRLSWSPDGTGLAAVDYAVKLWQIRK